MPNDLLTKMERGDMLLVNGVNDEDEKEEWLAEYYGKHPKKKDILLINYIEPSEKNPNILQYNTREEFDECHVDCVNTWASSHVGFSSDWKTPQEGYIAACKEIGYRMLDENSFIKEENYNPEVDPIGKFDGFTSEEEDDGSDCDSFIVNTSDLESEPECSEVSEDEFVAETHKAVSEFDNFEPKTKKQKRVKAFIDDLAAKIVQREDEKRFEKGKPALSTQA